MIAVRPLFAEFLGTAAIVATVLGAGHMVVDLEATAALGLLMISVAVGSVLFGVIAALGPISGAHFNPVVSLAFLLKRELPMGAFLSYLLAQLVGAIAGAALANSMFDQAPLSISSVDRLGFGILLGELLATFGLVLLILLLVDKKPQLIPAAVALWIVAGHIFTSSTSLANPAVSIGRMLSDAPSSISPASIPGYVVMQILGGLLALMVSNLITKQKEEHV